MINLAITFIIIVPLGFFIYRWAAREWEKADELEKEKKILNEIIESNELSGQPSKNINQAREKDL